MGEFFVKTVKGGIALVGNDSALDPGFEENERRALGKGTRKATVWAVYDFMERVFGMRFFYPGPDGTLLPTRQIDVLSLASGGACVLGGVPKGNVRDIPRQEFPCGT